MWKQGWSWSPIHLPCADPHFLNCPDELVVMDVAENSKVVNVNIDLKARDCKGDNLDVLLSDDELVAGVGEENFHLLSATSARDDKGNFAECVFHVRVRGREGYCVAPLLFPVVDVVFSLSVCLSVSLSLSVSVSVCLSLSLIAVCIPAGFFIYLLLLFRGVPPEGWGRSRYLWPCFHQSVCPSVCLGYYSPPFLLHFCLCGSFSIIFRSILLNLKVV